MLIHARKRCEENRAPSKLMRYHLEIKIPVARFLPQQRKKYK